MKIAAHPLIVAAAFGLLGPAALADDEMDASCEHCDCSAPSQCDVLDDEPSQEDFARIEAEWQAAVVRLDEKSGAWS